MHSICLRFYITHLKIFTFVKKDIYWIFDVLMTKVLGQAVVQV